MNHSREGVWRGRGRDTCLSRVCGPSSASLSTFLSTNQSQLTHQHCPHYPHDQGETGSQHTPKSHMAWYRRGEHLGLLENGDIEVLHAATLQFHTTCQLPDTSRQPLSVPVSTPHSSPRQLTTHMSTTPHISTSQSTPTATKLSSTPVNSTQ